MSSIRQRIINSVAAKIAAAVGPSVPVLVMPTLPRDRSEALFVVARAIKDAPEKVANDRAERQLTIGVACVSRQANAGFASCDTALAEIHAALLADMTLAGLALRIDEGETRYLADDADAAALAIETFFSITYRTSRYDVRQTG